MMYNNIEYMLLFLANI